MFDLILYFHGSKQLGFPPHMLFQQSCDLGESVGVMFGK
jgi:hypothetical protein